MSREGNRDTLKVARVLKPRGAQSVTSLVLMREQNALRELRSPKTGKPEDKQGSVEGTMTPAEKVAHDSRCEMCIEVGGTSRHPRRTVAEAAHIDNATVKHSHHCSENQDLGWCLSARAGERNLKIWRSFSVILVHSGPCGTLNVSKTFLRRSHHMRHTLSTMHRATLLDAWSEFLCNVGQTMTDSKGSWSVGRVDTKVQTSVARRQRETQRFVEM